MLVQSQEVKRMHGEYAERREMRTFMRDLQRDIHTDRPKNIE